MTTPVVLALRAEGTSAVIDALRSVRSAQMAMEEASISTARSAAQKRLEILNEELHAAAAMRLVAAKTTQDGLSRIAGVGTGATQSLAPTRGAFAGDTGIRNIDAAMAKWASTGDIVSTAAALFQGSLGLATAGLKQFASFVLADVVKPALALETRAAQLANNSGGTMTATGIQAQARALGIKNNLDPMAILEHADMLRQKTGSPQLALDMMGVIGTISKGRGVDMGDLTKMAGAVYQPGMKQADLQRILLMQTAMGDKGGITIGEMAKLGPKMLGPAESLAGNYETRLAETGALIQSAKGLGAGMKRAGGVKSFIDEAIAHGGPGVLTDASGERKLADPAMLIGELLAKTGGDVGKLKAQGFKGPGAELVRAYRGQFQESFDAAKGRGEADPQARADAGKAVEAFIKSFATASTTMESEEAKRNDVLATSGQKWEVAINSMKEKLLVVMPTIDKFIDNFASHGDEIAAAAVALVEVFTDVAEAALSVVEWYDKLTGKKGEGDVLKTVLDKGAETHLPRMEDKGYWLQEKGSYKYIKGAEDKAVDDTKNKGLELLHTYDDGAGLYKRANPKAPDPLDFYKGFPEANISANDGRTQSIAAGGATGGSDAATTSHEAVAKAADKSAKAIDTFASKLDALSSSMDGLNRTEAFSPGP